MLCYALLCSLYSLLDLLHLVTSSIQLCTSQKKSDLDCYYEPLSKCTIQDALAGADGKQVSIDDITHVGDIPRGEEDKYMQKYISKKYNLFSYHKIKTFCFNYCILFWTHFVILLPCCN